MTLVRVNQQGTFHSFGCQRKTEKCLETRLYTKIFKIFNCFLIQNKGNFWFKIVGSRDLIMVETSIPTI